MDPSAINNAFSLLAFLALVVLGILQMRRPVSSKESGMAAQTQPVTNGKATKDYVDAKVQYHELHCSRADEIIRRLERIEDKLDRLGGN
jgi:hypothetical protein